MRTFSRRLRGSIRPVEILHVFVLVAFALAQPLFDLLARNATFFIARRSAPVDLILLVLFLCVIPPFVIVVFEAIGGVIGRRLQRGLHLSIVAALLAITVLPVMKRAPLATGSAVVAASVAIGAIGAVAYNRAAPFRLLFTVLAPTPLIFAALFLFDPHISSIILRGDTVPRWLRAATPTAPIVMVIFDEFDGATLTTHAGRIDDTDYPGFARLASAATWYRNATTVHTHTTQAVPAILTGKFSSQDALPTAQDHPDSIFTWLGDSYSMNVTEVLTQLCPVRICARSSLGEPPPITARLAAMASDLGILYLHVILPSDRTRWLPPISQRWGRFAENTDQSEDWAGRARALVISARETDRGEAFEAFMNSINSSDLPSLNVLHILLPHVPYQYLPSGQTYPAGSMPLGLQGEVWTANEFLVGQEFERYRLQVGFVDRLIGQLLDRLESTGLYDRSLIVVTADHGVCFRPGESRRLLGPTNVSCIAKVPLFIKAPRQKTGATSDRNIQSIDILPTMADILDVRLPWKSDGQSAVDSSVPERTQKLVISDTGSKVWLGRQLDASATERAESPFADLVGRPVAEFSPAPRAALAAKLDRVELFRDVNPRGGFVPAQVTGHVLFRSPAARPVWVAIAINGRIAAVGISTAPDGGAAAFSILVPLDVFRPGRNDIEVMLASRINGLAQVSRVESLTTFTYRLSSTPSGEALVASDGTTIRIAHEHIVAGSIDVASAAGLHIQLAGWSADTEHGELPAAVVMFQNGSFLTSGRLEIPRPDVAEHYGQPQIRNAGFDLSTYQIGALQGSRIRVFSITKRGVAYELFYSRPFPWE